MMLECYIVFYSYEGNDTDFESFKYLEEALGFVDDNKGDWADYVLIKGSRLESKEI